MAWLGVVAESLRELGRKRGPGHAGFALSNPNEAKNAADAFRWCLEESHLMEIPEHFG
jgi:hypothetical protein